MTINSSLVLYAILSTDVHNLYVQLLKQLMYICYTGVSISSASSSHEGDRRQAAQPALSMSSDIPLPYWQQKGTGIPRLC